MSQDPILMKCGCTSQGVRTATAGKQHEPIPCCVVHDCLEPAETGAPNLEGRIARCTYKSCKTYLAKYRDTHYGELDEKGRSFAPSSLSLPFFRYHPEKLEDEYFCGCMGWD